MPKPLYKPGEDNKPRGEYVEVGPRGGQVNDPKNPRRDCHMTSMLVIHPRVIRRRSFMFSICYLCEIVNKKFELIINSQKSPTPALPTPRQENKIKTPPVLPTPRAGRRCYQHQR